SLGVEQRASEVGLLLAMGFPIRSVRRRFLGEGVVLSAAGCLLGAGAAVGYAGAMMVALRTWWRAAVGTPFLYLHVVPATVGVGAAIGFLVVVASIWLSVRRLGRLSVVGLVRGVAREPRGPQRPSRAGRVAWVAGGAGIALLAGGLIAGEGSTPALFFAGGSALLVAGLAAFAHRLHKPVGRLGPDSGRLSMAARNNALNPGRSLLSAALVSSAAFVIVAVAANGFRYGAEVRELDSAAGGYSVVAESAIPVHHDLTSADAAFELGFPAAARELLDATKVTAFRLLPGDDVSCLNLYQPESPRILGVPPEQIERGGFRFQQLAEERDDPWSLLGDDLGEAVPAFGDVESMTWILKKGLGDEIVVESEGGRPLRLRLVGLLEKSLFQGEVLISEAAFKRHFPSRTGYRFFLIDPPAGREAELAELLEDRLGDYGFDATPTAEKLQRFQAVFNTYLATFQTLGGLGLLLGTVGLAAILLRNVLERRGELATLRALGFRRRSLAGLVVAENALLLMAGVAIGAVAALLAVSPHLLAGNALVPWGSLAAILTLIVALGMLASVAAVRRALSVPLLPSLKGD
ncbi:MAG: ABC transporter permease, partial [Thermoanaerobaculia bacterium]|nr:ABC transporter permease [Thermoanaerobaculia bacterium]